MKPTLIFDYDGTIHETMKLYEPAYKRGLDWLKEDTGRDFDYPTMEDLRRYLGMNAWDTWKDTVPWADDWHIEKGIALVGQYMNDILLETGAVWYEGIEESLKALKSEGYELFVASNTVRSYRDVHWKEFDMGRFFTDFYDAQSYNYIPKGEMIADFCKKRGIGQAVVIGDRIHDLEAAKYNGFRFIGALYGYGSRQELKDADLFLEDSLDLYKAIKGLGE